MGEPQPCDRGWHEARQGSRESADPDVFAALPDIPVTLQGAEPDARALSELREVGVTRATLSAPSTGGDEVLRFLDDVAPLVDAVGAA